MLMKPDSKPFKTQGNHHSSSFGHLIPYLGQDLNNITLDRNSYHEQTQSGYMLTLNQR